MLLFSKWRSESGLKWIIERRIERKEGQTGLTPWLALAADQTRLLMMRYWRVGGRAFGGFPVEGGRKRRAGEDICRIWKQRNTALQFKAHCMTLSSCIIYKNKSPMIQLHLCFLTNCLWLLILSLCYSPDNPLNSSFDNQQTNCPLSEYFFFCTFLLVFYSSFYSGICLFIVVYFLRLWCTCRHIPVSVITPLSWPYTNWLASLFITHFPPLPCIFMSTVLRLS